MSKLTLDEAIKHCLEVAEQNDTQAEKWQEEGGEQWGKTTACRECAADRRQLAEWLMELKDLKAEQNDQYVFIHELMSELKEAKRLLKVAIEDLSNTAAEAYNGHVICKCCKWLAETVYCKCPNDGGCDITYQWRYADEALKLIGDSENDEP